MVAANYDRWYNFSLTVIIRGSILECVSGFSGITLSCLRKQLFRRLKVFVCSKLRSCELSITTDIIRGT